MRQRGRSAPSPLVKRPPLRLAPGPRTLRRVSAAAYRNGSPADPHRLGGESRRPRLPPEPAEEPATASGRGSDDHWKPWVHQRLVGGSMVAVSNSVWSGHRHDPSLSARIQDSEIDSSAASSATGALRRPFLRLGSPGRSDRSELHSFARRRSADGRRSAP